jgi:hypothetical protein
VVSLASDKSPSFDPVLFPFQLLLLLFQLLTLEFVPLLADHHTHLPGLDIMNLFLKLSLLLSQLLLPLVQFTLPFRQLLFPLITLQKNKPHSTLTLMTLRLLALSIAGAFLHLLDKSGSAAVFIVLEDEGGVELLDQGFVCQMWVRCGKLLDKGLVGEEAGRCWVGCEVVNLV